MPLLDERGRVFGVVNVVDAIVLLVIFASVVAGGALVTSVGAQAVETTSSTVVVRTTVAPYVHAAAETGTATAGDVESIDEIRVTDRIALNTSERVTQNANRLVRIDVQLTAGTQTRSDGLLYFRDERLYVGRELRLDLGATIIEGVVVDIDRRR